MKKIFIDTDNIDYAEINKVADVIHQGGVVALPTETVYGLAVCSNNDNAIKRLYEIKQRTKEKSCSVAVSDMYKARDLFSTLSPFGNRLMEKLWPGPLTIIYYSNEDKKIGIRVPSHPVARAVLEEVSSAVCLSSANISGEKEAHSAKDVEDIFGDKIDLVVDGGESIFSHPSTVIDLTYYPFKLLREGVVSEREIVDIFVKKRIMFVCTGNTCRSPMAEFLLKKYLYDDRPYLRGVREIVSRGIYPIEGARVSLQVARILKKEENIDIINFHSQRLDRDALLSSDLIFTMEDAQGEYILNLEPTVEGRLFPLKKFLLPDLEKDIQDPIGQGDDVYFKVYSIVKEAILELKEWL